MGIRIFCGFPWFIGSAQAGGRDRPRPSAWTAGVWRAWIALCVDGGSETDRVTELESRGKPCRSVKMNSVSDITGNASLMLFFATDTGSALTAPVIRVTPTVFFVAKTIRSLTVILCFIAEQHCFLKLQHCSATELICFIARKFFSLNEVALPGPEQHCFGVKQHCSGVKQH